MIHGSSEVSRAGQHAERVTVAFLTLVWFFILLRTWTRTWIIAGFGWDDATMILAGMVFTVYAGSQFYLEANGGGTHVTSLEKLQDLTKWAIVGESTYLVAMMVAKISLGIFFARIVIVPWHIKLIYVTLGFNIFSSAASFFYVILRCGPNLDRYVLQQLKNQCAPRSLDRFMAYQSATVITVTDLVFVVLPIVILWNANMDRKSKISAGFVLCLAASACICSMIRFQYVDGLTQIEDFFWNATNIAIWSTIESGASIVAGCLATLRPLLKRVFVTAGSITKSLRSSQARSNISSTRINGSTSTTTHLSSRERKTRDSSTDKPIYAEFIAEPGEVIELSSDSGGERESQDQILRQHNEATLDFPWPAKIVDHPTKQARTAPMHSKHRSWNSKNRTTSKGDPSARRSSAPSSPSAHVSNT